MNKYQKAYRRLYEDDYISYRGINMAKRRQKDFDLMKKLVDKEEPKKILTSVGDNGEPFLPRGYGECPKCKTVVECNNNYCCECGQRLE